MKLLKRSRFRHRSACTDYAGRHKSILFENALRPLFTGHDSNFMYGRGWGKTLGGCIVHCASLHNRRQGISVSIRARWAQSMVKKWAESLLCKLRPGLVRIKSLPFAAKLRSWKLFENIVGKGKNAGSQHLFLFPTMFSILSFKICMFWVSFNMSSASVLNFKSYKILSSCKVLIKRHTRL